MSPSAGGSSSGRGTKARAQAAGATRTTPPTKRAASAKSASAAGARAESSRGSAPEPTARPLDPDRLVALEDERDFLLRSLRDLEAEHDVGDVDDGDYAALKDDYTARAATVLRSIEGHHLELSAARPARSVTRRVIVAVAVALFTVGTGVLVAQWSGTRGAGDSITGGIRSDTRDQLLEARQAFAQNPPQYLQAIKIYDQVLKEDPANVEALSYRGWMYRLVSLQATGAARTELQTQARSSLAQALRTDAKDATSLIFMAAVLDDLGQPAQALADLDAVPAAQIPSVVTGLVSQLRARLTTELRSTPASSTTTTG